LNKKFDVMSMIKSISYEPQLNLIAQMFSDEQKKDMKILKFRYDINSKDYIILENEYAKVVVGEDYNYIFLKKDMFGHMTGYFKRWGKSPEDDPQFSPIGPEILDLEISVNGCPNACSFCSPVGTLISTPDGVKLIEQIKNGDDVVGFDLSSNKQTIQKVVDVYERDYSGDMIDIQLDNDRTLSLTPEHEVYTKSGWKLAKNLMENDEVLHL